MKSKNIFETFFQTACIILLLMIFSQTAFSVVLPGTVLYKGNLGGLFGQASAVKVDTFTNYDFVIAGNGIGSFGAGDFSTLNAKGNYDALTAVFNFDSNADKFDIGYTYNFGGANIDHFLGIKVTSDGGYVAVGYSQQASFNTYDWSGITGWGGIGPDAIIVKFNSIGNIDWKKKFGGGAGDYFESVTTTSDGGYVVVGRSGLFSFGGGDWTGISGKGASGSLDDAIIVKFNSSGTAVWKKVFGGDGNDNFHSISNTLDGGYIVCGFSEAGSFGTGDWAGISGKGNSDGITVKYDASGNMVWKKTFGGSAYDDFNSVITLSDGGYVVVGRSDSVSFGNGDWSGLVGKGDLDCTIVKFDSTGNFLWKNSFGGAGADDFNAVASTFDGGFVAVGESYSTSFGTGDWASISGKGNNDAIITKFNSSGVLIWKKNFGGSSADVFSGIGVRYNGDVLAVGQSVASSFGNGDWVNVAAKGDASAIYAVFRDVLVCDVDFLKYANNPDVIVAYKRVAEGSTINPTDVPVPDRIGFIFDGWYKDAALTVLFDFNEPITSDIYVYPKWIPEPERIYIDYYDGFGNKARNVGFCTYIDFEAKPVLDNGDQFQYWKMSTAVKENEIFSYDRILSFTATENMTLIAVYGGSAPPAAAPIVLIDDASMEKDYGIQNKVDVSFFGDIYMPDSVTLVDRGFIGSYYDTNNANYDWNETNFVLGAPKVTRVPIPGSDRKVQATFKNVLATWSYAGRAYLKYIDPIEGEKVIYSGITIRTP